MPSSHRVWVIDDDRSIRWVLEKALQKAANHSARQAGIMQRLGTHTLRYTPLSARRLAKMA